MIQNLMNTSIWKQKDEPSGVPAAMIEAQVDDLNLSVRSYNCLKRAGINTVGQLLTLLEGEEDNLKKIRNLGAKSEKEIRERVAQYRNEASTNGLKDPVARLAPFLTGLRVTDKGRVHATLEPGVKYFNRSIDTLGLRPETIQTLKTCGINRVVDLYSRELKKEPGWFAVRELLAHIQ